MALKAERALNVQICAQRSREKEIASWSVGNNGIIKGGGWN